MVRPNSITYLVINQSTETGMAFLKINCFNQDSLPGEGDTHPTYHEVHSQWKIKSRIILSNKVVNYYSNVPRSKSCNHQSMSEPKHRQKNHLAEPSSNF